MAYFICCLFVWYQEHGRKGRKDKDDREGGTKSRKERGSSARKGKAAHGAPSPPPSITPAEEDKRLALHLIISRPIRECYKVNKLSFWWYMFNHIVTEFLCSKQ